MKSLFQANHKSLIRVLRHELFRLSRKADEITRQSKIISKGKSSHKNEFVLESNPKNSFKMLPYFKRFI
jgi:hypothetical protein